MSKFSKIAPYKFVRPYEDQLYDDNLTWYDVILIHIFGAISFAFKVFITLLFGYSLLLTFSEMFITKICPLIN